MTTQSCERLAAASVDLLKNVMLDNFEECQNERELESGFGDDDDDALLAISIRIRARVAYMLSCCCQFESLANELRQEPDCMDGDRAAAVLASSDSRSLEIKRALVFLALEASAESGRIIHLYMPPVNSARLQAFHSVVKVEWENRTMPGFLI